MEELKKYIDLKFKKIEKRLENLEKYIKKDEFDIDNFENTNEVNIDIYKYVIFTDGACSKKIPNKPKNGGFGIYIKDKTIIEILKEFKLYKKCNTDKFTINTETLDKQDFNNEYLYEITNIRAEGYAILYTLIIFKYLLIDKNKQDKQELLNYLNNMTIFPYNNFKEKITISNNPITNDILIITDSEFWINVITKWSVNWFYKNTICNKKNIDLVLYILYYYHLLLKNDINVEFLHINGHAERKGVNCYSYNEIGNMEADKLAVKSKNCIDYLFHYD